MTIVYTPQPHGATPRPLVDVEINHADFAVKGLVDTGAVNTLFGRWVADTVGIDLGGLDPQTISVGGQALPAHFVTVTLTAAGFTWEAEVGFCDNWQPNWALLGHHAFLRFFVLTVRAADNEFELEPINE